MNKLRRKFILSLFFILTVLNPTFAQGESANVVETNIQNVVQTSIPDSKIETVSEEEFKVNQVQETKKAVEEKPETSDESSYFNFSNIVDNILTNEPKQEAKATNKVANIDEKSLIRKEFISITSKFNQGNAKVAYDEYELLINKVENDASLLALARVFYEIGFFSLANKAIEKIEYKNQYYDSIYDLEISYKTKNKLTIEEEIYFAKIYSNIYFNNSSQEMLVELSKNKTKYQKNDFYYFMTSRAFMESKQYHNALNMINKAISANPVNINYHIFKIDILIKSTKFKDAKRQIEKLEKLPLLLAFSPKIEAYKQVVYAAVTDDIKSKKYFMANKNYVEGNFEKTKKDCLNILNFDKDNEKILSLYAKSELALGNVNKANAYFVNSYKIEKNNLDTIIGLGDIRYIHGDYKNALKMYKKAYRKDKNNYEAIIKLATAQRQHAKNPKELKKLEVLLDKMPKNAYKDYYKSAISIAQKNTVLKEDFLKRSLNVNPMYENAIGELIELYLKNKNYDLAKNLIYNVSFTLEKNFYYYYLCGLYSQATDKKNDAIQFYKTSLNLNPNFEIAGKRLLKLLPDLEQEEI